MQTFLPYPSFTDSAKVLDRQRLGKQRSENIQIYNSLTEGGGWRNHPAVRMWQGYEQALVHYAIAIVNEWADRGYIDSTYTFWYPKKQPSKLILPWWLGNEKFHQSHRSKLVQKMPEHYKWNEPVMDYYWPLIEER